MGLLVLSALCFGFKLPGMYVKGSSFHKMKRKEQRNELAKSHGMYTEY